MSEFAITSTIKFFWRDILGDLFAFPLWWYSKGTLRVIRYIMRSAANRAASLSLRIWIKNLFVPMYAQYDLAGRIISFVLRVVVLIYRAILFVVWFVILLALLGVWLFGPIGIIYYILYQLFGITLSV